jgi:hypothetical protein
LYSICSLAHKGKSAYLIKDSSSRKRKFKELEEVKQEESELKENKQAFLAQYKMLKESNASLLEKVDNMHHYETILDSLYKSGVINEEGLENIPLDFNINLH